MARAKKRKTKGAKKEVSSTNRMTNVSKIEGENASVKNELNTKNGDSEEHNLATQTGSVLVNAIPSPLRIPGPFGDFCFGRKKDEMQSEIHEQEYDPFHSASNNVVFVELDDFERSGTFAWSRLPIEVRLKIMKLLLGPIYCYDARHKKSFIPLHLCENGGLPFVEFPDDYKTYQNIDQDSRAYCWYRTLTPYQFRQAKKEVAERLKAHPIHPHRSGRYTLRMYPILPERGTRDLRRIDYPDRSMIDWIQKLSTVSVDFRNELAEVFWTRIHLEVWDAHVVDLIPFFKDRPAALKAIKCLAITANGDRTCCSNEYEDFPKVVDLLAKSLQLEELMLTMNSEEESLAKVSSGGYPDLLYLSGLTSLKVSRSFHFYFRTFFTGTHSMSEKEREKEGIKSDAEIWEDGELMVRQLLMPDSLRLADAEAVKNKEEPEEADCSWLYRTNFCA